MLDFLSNYPLNVQRGSFGIFRICLRSDRTLLSIRNGFTTLRTLCLRTFSYGRVIYCWFYRRLSPLVRLLSAFLLLLWVYLVQSKD